MVLANSEKIIFGNNEWYQNADKEQEPTVEKDIWERRQNTQEDTSQKNIFKKGWSAEEDCRKGHIYMYSNTRGTKTEWMKKDKG